MGPLGSSHYLGSDLGVAADPSLPARVDWLKRPVLAGSEDRHGNRLGAMAKRSADGAPSRAHPGRRMAGKNFRIWVDITGRSAYCLKQAPASPRSLLRQRYAHQSGPWPARLGGHLGGGSGSQRVLASWSSERGCRDPGSVSVKAKADNSGYPACMKKCSRARCQHSRTSYDRARPSCSEVLVLTVKASSKAKFSPAVMTVVSGKGKTSLYSSLQGGLW